ncbi:hypothetical protein M422DRAFT_258739 [Sphaerobolus stellatus SS14]|uniref:F-box domain-containing protein n=1 Tax=Sphaerobolus stellatus (strain SS14) TaxID=990650 RepID=A0A0C9VLV1_SPHS4|nr:hypothetical protein M422DRAFT_258739 [Sphaerobolus stellatus SS14]
MFEHLKPRFDWPFVHYFHAPLEVLALSHVSSRWRFIARSHSSMWKEIHPYNPRFTAMCSDLASTARLEVSTAATLCGCCSRGSLRKSEILDGVCDFIRQNADRISKLFLYISVAAMKPLMDIFLTTPFPELTVFLFPMAGLLMPTGMASVPLFAGHAPKLQHAGWGYSRLPPMSIFKNLTSLFFATPHSLNVEPKWTQLMSILPLNPNLETMAMQIPRSSVASGSTQINIPLLRLRKISLWAFVIQDLQAFFEAIEAPQIEQISLVVQNKLVKRDVLAALHAQPGLLSLIVDADSCKICSGELEEIDLSFWNSANGKKLHISFLGGPQRTLELIMLMRVPTYLQIMPSQYWSISIPQMLSVTVLCLGDGVQEGNYTNLSKWIDENSLPSLKTIILPKQYEPWWDVLLPVLEGFIRLSPKPELVYQYDCDRELLEAFSSRTGVSLRHIKEK